VLVADLQIRLAAGGPLAPNKRWVETSEKRLEAIRSEITVREKSFETFNALVRYL